MTSSTARTPYRALISAHRCGRADRVDLDNRVAGVLEAARLGAHYVEFDIQRTRDGVYVCQHDDEVATGAGRRERIDELTFAQLRQARPDIDTLDAIVDAVTRTDLAAHLDLKFTSPRELHAGTPEDTWEVECVTRCLRALGAQRIIVTTTEDASVKTLRTWVRRHHLHDILVGLSLGRHPRGLGLTGHIRVRASELFPARRLKDCDATLLVSHHLLARIRLLRFAARRNLPVLVFTVDGHRTARRLVTDRRVWLLTTNWPSRLLSPR